MAWSCCVRLGVAEAGHTTLTLRLCEVSLFWVYKYTKRKKEGLNHTYCVVWWYGFAFRGFVVALADGA